MGGLHKFYPTGLRVCRQWQQTAEPLVVDLPTTNEKLGVFDTTNNKAQVEAWQNGRLMSLLLSSV